MAYSQTPGRGNGVKTGAGIPSPLLQETSKKGKPNFTGSRDKGSASATAVHGTPNTDLGKVAVHYGKKALGAVADAAQWVSDAANGKKGSKDYSVGDESMRQKNIRRK